MGKVRQFHIHRIANILKNQGAFQEFQDYLPSPDYVSNLITLTNAGDIGEALFDIEKTQQILNLVSDDLNAEERQWLSGIVEQLKQNVSSALGDV
jgi:hypothetical protein